MPGNTNEFNVYLQSLYCVNILPKQFRGPTFVEDQSNMEDVD